jgi:hypothetical protein
VVLVLAVNSCWIIFNMFITKHYNFLRIVYSIYIIQ